MTNPEESSGLYSRLDLQGIVIILGASENFRLPVFFLQIFFSLENMATFLATKKKNAVQGKKQWEKEFRDARVRENSERAVCYRYRFFECRGEGVGGWNN